VALYRRKSSRNAKNVQSVEIRPQPHHAGSFSVHYFSYHSALAVDGMFKYTINIISQPYHRTESKLQKFVRPPFSMKIVIHVAKCMFIMFENEVEWHLETYKASLKFSKYTS
jgi:hypothetical protein